MYMNRGKPLTPEEVSYVEEKLVEFLRGGQHSTPLFFKLLRWPFERRLPDVRRHFDFHRTNGMCERLTEALGRPIRSVFCSRTMVAAHEKPSDMDLTDCYE